MADEVLTLKEVAALLKLAEKTVYAMAQAGEIPAFKATEQKLFRSVFTQRDAKTEPVLSGGRGVGCEADADLRDFENVPLKEALALLKERRAALIAAAVTGQLDVMCERSGTGGA